MTFAINTNTVPCTILLNDIKQYLICHNSYENPVIQTHQQSLIPCHLPCTPGEKSVWTPIITRFSTIHACYPLPLSILPCLSPTTCPWTSAGPHAHTSKVVHNCLYYDGNHDVSFNDTQILGWQYSVSYIKSSNSSFHICVTKTLMAKT
jgi:hypothetical protein